MHSFGIGNDCDRHLVNGAAKAGRGSASFVRDGEKELNKLVVKSLARSIEPSLEQCSLTLAYEGANQREDLGEVFRNELIFKTQIIKKAEFESLKVNFDC